MNAVVLTVKASYVASTKYPRQAAASGLNAKPIVVWKMKVITKNKRALLFLQDLVRPPPPLRWVGWSRKARPAFFTMVRVKDFFWGFNELLDF